MAVVPITYGFVGKELTPLELMERFKTERSLTDSEIDQLGIQLVPPGSTRDELGWSEPNALVKIPYWGVTGEKLLDNRGGQLSRYRRTVVNAKGERYTQRKGTGARHYLPRLEGVDWHSIAKDPSIPIYYTEGEFKAIAGCKNLGPTIGNAGVNAWRGLDGALGSPLDQFEWKDRDVYLCYDAEASSTAAVPLKHTVEKALGELAVDLRVRGAKVWTLLIAKTPSFVEGIKLGLDDYFHAGGTRENLLATRTEPEVDSEWDSLFTNFAVYTGPKPHILDIQRYVPYSAKDFRELIITNTRVQDGKPRKLADIYREHPMRNWFDEYIFDPSKPSGFLREEHKYNTWKGWACEPVQSEKYEEHIAIFTRYQSGLWGEKNVSFFLDWCSQIFQRPAERTTKTPILVSKVKGIGKSMTGDILQGIIGAQGAFSGTIDGATGRFAGELEGKLVMVLDEADALFEGKEGKLKWLTGENLRIEHKGRETYFVRNYLRTILFTNENAPIRIAEDERRYWVVRSPLTARDGLSDSEWSTWLRTVVGPLKRDPEFLSNVMAYLTERNIDHWDSFAPVPRTEDMDDMVEAGRSKKSVEADQLYQALCEHGIWMVDPALMAMDNKLWGDVRASLKNDGGRVVGHQFKDKDQKRTCTVWMIKNRLLSITEGYGGKAAQLAGGQLGAPECRQMLLDTRKEMDAIKQLVDSSKF